MEPIDNNLPSDRILSEALRQICVLIKDAGYLYTYALEGSIFTENDGCLILAKLRFSVGGKPLMFALYVRKDTPCQIFARLEDYDSSVIDYVPTPAIYNHTGIIRGFAVEEILNTFASLN